MKFLILSVSAGGGHIHAAFALKKYIAKYLEGSQVKMLDTIKYLNPFLDKVLIGGYLKTLKVSPALFGKLYNFTEKDDNLASLSNKINEFMAYKLIPIIEDFNPDVIICTHPFPTEMVSILKSKESLKTPMLCILTDYAPHSFWIRPQVNSYVVSNSDMVDEMVRRGVNRENIYDLGIPVDPDFIRNFDKIETLNELNLSLNKKTILIMGGSLGIGKIEDIYEALSKSRANIQIIIITGNNKKLYSKLLELAEDSYVETRILGYTRDVNRYMQASDLLLTKPGGLTITEALICRVPLAVFSPIPGQEEKNEDFLLKHNLAISIRDSENCLGIIESLISNPELLQAMKDNCNKFSKPSSGKDICNLLINLINKNQKIDVNNADYRN
ncbi:processive 1,2-diacylglycerol beta-glucosyltransferase [Clostridium acetobutylicum]|uniref:Predicted UDP-glucuronosyltransferase, YPFP B/subtilis ortholog n=1 Tax=Clostridium acetobutylicum (strain ATCC 824 / DSM 792 / JCM 1419 / IAM 19013 / LMG 5710 / NBRC 13948 / NRRL B-527 / VKM B-1787 / 2291 / W) TaxID=272562 RepID=Q97F56_CLOAB|nr:MULTISPECIES: glycosyltransferase [Clostridium]AAK80839.1 Predicted UDP-glucuronosyltransferase, YPFP B/subtilis ortholog [Clostridium acetobutylicum ATCC 824]ADZ21941.1 UDP-glucuronosyltransferase [Clostridium acetobutylicum EA 2018]AEI34017.1 UDP-glucuronosyltransferase [Clostridium acetobutylicum DSM 1731]AWV78749.1 UDP-N-acetylglucosamine--LPS N-acetylglucosamine transferase [Clostridium acetobutylicum]MBC2393612.1 UDP-N-acetylglucosamine--LPS N-acetylglucosamine transferase [Clostridiu